MGPWVFLKWCVLCRLWHEYWKKSWWNKINQNQWLPTPPRFEPEWTRFQSQFFFYFLYRWAWVPECFCRWRVLYCLWRENSKKWTSLTRMYLAPFRAIESRFLTNRRARSLSTSICLCSQSVGGFYGYIDVHIYVPCAFEGHQKLFPHEPQSKVFFYIYMVLFTIYRVFYGYIDVHLYVPCAWEGHQESFSHEPQSEVFFYIYMLLFTIYRGFLWAIMSRFLTDHRARSFFHKFMSLFAIYRFFSVGI